MAMSKFILDIAKEIERKSGANQATTIPSKKWITERQMSKMKAIQLRTADDIKNESALAFPHFNPSFFLKDGSKVHCRIPGCSATTQRLKSNSSKKIKQDLFLCSTHRARLTSEVVKRCAKEDVIVKVASFKQEDFNGYTSLIGQLEKAFTHVKKQNSLLAEVFLNTRNFLIITNALLNPNEDNTPTALAPYLTVFDRIILSYIEDPQRLQSLVAALREIMSMILRFFGVIYDWLFVENPGGRVGSGLGLALGFIGSVAFGFSPAGIFVAAVVGLLSGKLIGSGGYDMRNNRQNTQQEMIQQCQEFMVRLFGQQGTQQRGLFFVSANADGDILINIEVQTSTTTTFS